MTIIYDGGLIEWSKFFFLKAEYPDAWEVCKKTRSRRYPKAFHGVVRTVSGAAEGRIAAILKGTLFPANAKDLKEGVVTSVAPRFTIPEHWNLNLRQERQIVVVGFAISATERAYEKEARVPKHNLRLINLKLRRRGPTRSIGLSISRLGEPKPQVSKECSGPGCSANYDRPNPARQLRPPVRRSAYGMCSVSKQSRTHDLFHPP